MERAIAAFAMAVAVAGCAGARPGGGEPRVTAETQEIDDRDQTLTGVVARVRVRLTNPLPAAAVARAARWELVVGGAVVRSGEATLAIEVPASGEAVAEFAVPYEYAANDDELARLAQKGGRLDYAVRGALDVGGRAVEFARAAAVRAPRLPALELESIEAVNSNTEGLTVNAVLDLSNPNPFPVALKGLRWTLALAGQRLGEGLVAKKDVARPASHTRYEVSASLDLDELKARKNLPAAGSVPYSLEAELDLGQTKVRLEQSGEARLLRYTE